MNETSLDLIPSRTVFVAMDFQPSIQGTLPNPDIVTRAAARAAAATRAAGGKVALVRVAFTSEELAAFPQHSAMGQRMNSIAEKVMSDAAGTQIDALLGRHPADIAVRKRRVGPFSTTDLDAQIRGAGADTLVLSGIHTSGCVLTAVREAFDLDYRIVVLSDACADPDRDIHDVLFSRIFPKQAQIADVECYLAAMSERAGS